MGIQWTPFIVIFLKQQNSVFNIQNYHKQLIIASFLARCKN